MYLPFEKNLQANGDFSGQSSRLSMVDLLESYTSNGQSYNKVIKVNITNSLVANRKDMSFYWAKNVGIIKKENLTDGETWNLIDYNIVK